MRKIKYIDPPVLEINDEFIKELRVEMIKAGMVFPETDEEVELFMKHCPKCEVPDKFKTPDFLFKE